MALVALIIITIFLLHLDAISYSANDDFGFIQISSGLFSGTPDNDLIFVSAFISEPLKYLYTNFATEPWYSTLQILTLVLIFIGIDILLKIKITQSRFKRILFLSLVIFFSLPFIYNYQFTQLAILASGIGVYLFFNSNSSYKSSLALLLIIIGISWRLQGGLLGISIGISYVFIQMVVNKRSHFNRIDAYKILIFLVVLCVSYLAHFFVNNPNSPFISNDKKSYLILNNQRGEFQARTLFQEEKETKKFKKVLKSVNWSFNDYNLITNNFYIADFKIFNTPNLREFNSLLPSTRITTSVKVAEKNIKHFYQYLTINKWNTDFALIVAFLILLQLFFIVFNLNKKTLYISILNLALFTIFIYITLSLGNVPYRVFYPIFILCLLFGSIIQIEQFKKQILLDVIDFRSNVNLLRLLLLFILSSLILILTLSFYTHYKNDVANNIFWNKKICEDENSGLKRVLEFDYDKPILMFSSFMTPLSNCTTPFRENLEYAQFWNNNIPVGWYTLSPSYFKKTQALSLHPNVLVSVLNGDAYIGIGNWYDVEIVTQYFRERFLKEVSWKIEPVAYSETGLFVLEIESVLEIGVTD